MSIDCVILAGGLSSRFPSPLPKVFYPFIDKPLIEHLLDHVTKLAFRKIIVVTGRKTHDYFEAYEKEGLICRVYQQEPAGTWDALITALPAIRSPECVVINGDMPLLDQRILKKIINSNANIALTSTIHPNPIGYGRLMRGTDKQLEAIIEEKHLTGDQYVTNEVNAGLYKFNVDFLKKIEISKNKNAQEWYLTSLWDKGSPYLAETQIIIEDDYRLLAGVNSWQDFEQAEVFYYQLQRESLVKQGVLLKNNQSIYIQGKVIGANHVTIEGPCVLKGPMTLAPGVSIKPFTTIADVDLKDSTTVGSFSYLNNIKTEQNVVLGPFLKAVEGTLIYSSSAIGSFVEIKRSIIGDNTKAKHFAYIADATLGASCNIGAFVVFCNYDGERKHRAFLGDNVFVGSSCQLISPVILNNNAYIGAGTTVTQDIPAGALITRRAPVRIIENWRGK